MSFFWEVSAGVKCDNGGTSPNSPKSKKKKRSKKKAKQAQAQEAPAVSVLVSAEVGVQTESVPDIVSSWNCHLVSPYSHFRRSVPSCQQCRKNFSSHCSTDLPSPEPL